MHLSLKSKKTVFISVFQSFVSRNILNTGVLNELLNRGFKVVLFVHPVKRNFYKEVYTHKNIFIETLDLDQYMSRRERVFKSLALLLISTNVMIFRKIKIRQKGGGFLRYLYQRIITVFFGKSVVVKTFFRWLDFNFNNPDAFDSYFKEYAPEVVFSPDIFGLGDVLMVKSAKKHRIRNVGMVASWDNNTTKGLMRVIPGKLLVQNEIIKDESIKIQAVPDEIIDVVGIAHYDYYRNYKPISREEFLRKVGIDSNKKFIVFSPAGDKFISTDWQICELLKRAYKEGDISEDIVTLVRTHPSNPVSLNDFRPDKHFVIDKPGVSFKGMNDKKNELDKKALHHLLDTLHHCELVINVVSSLVIDAAVFDKPIITIGFEGWEKKVPFGSSVKRYHMDENMAKLLSIGGTPVVKNKKELVDQINSYLSFPERDKEGRAKIIKKQCGKLDGKAKSRIAELIISKVEK